MWIKTEELRTIECGFIGIQSLINFTYNKEISFSVADKLNWKYCIVTDVSIGKLLILTSYTVCPRYCLTAAFSPSNFVTRTTLSR